jgi:hypothetical protein
MTAVNDIRALTTDQRIVIFDQAPDLFHLQARIASGFMRGEDIKALEVWFKERVLDVATSLGFLPTARLVLLDHAEDGYCERRGWVTVDATEDQARDALAEFCGDEDGESPWRPDCGPASRVWLGLVDLEASYEDQRWRPCHKDVAGAREFWEIPTS